MPNKISIPADFSVYHLVERIQQHSALLNHRRTMSLISYEIENASLVDHAQSIIFSGFQRFSSFIPQAKRYERLARQSKGIYVFGIDDADPPEIPNLTYVPLTRHHQLAKEWFLVSYGKEYCSALATEELTDMDDPDDTRMFKGIWTFDLQFTSLLYEWLAGTVGLRPYLMGEDQHDNRSQVRLMTNTMSRLLMRIMSEKDEKHATIIQGELKTLVKDSIQDAIMRYTDQATGSEPQQKEVVILFSGLHNISAMAAQMETHRLVGKIINPHLEVVSRKVFQHGGVVDKFLGDGVLAIFGLTDEGDPARQAIHAAMDIFNELRRIYPEPLPVGIGIAQGQAVVGQVGPSLHREETVIGDVIHVAQHLSELGDGTIWVSQGIYDQAQDTANFGETIRVHISEQTEARAAHRLV